MASKRSACTRAICWEFHISRFCLCHHNWKAFAYTPWLPQSAYFQWIYVLYRWIVALYFGVYLSWTLAVNAQYAFIYLTNWGLVSINVYMIWSCISVTVRYFVNFLPGCVKYRDPSLVSISGSVKKSRKPRGCCGQGHNSLRWYDYIHWILFTTTLNLAVLIGLLYWGALYNGSQVTDHRDVAVHLMNSLVALMELWITRIPVRLYHVIYIAIVSIAYDTFGGIYYAAEGSNGINNASYIYPIIDYENSPVTAAVLVLLFSVVCPPLVHILFYLIYLLREGLIYLFMKLGWISWLDETVNDDPVRKEKYTRKGSSSVELIS